MASSLSLEVLVVSIFLLKTGFSDMHVATDPCENLSPESSSNGIVMHKIIEAFHVYS